MPRQIGDGEKALIGEIVTRDPYAENQVSHEVPALMSRIRPQWQAKGLIERVRKLLPVDPSSACQRLLNAAIQDLREKILIAGLDIARDAAQEHHLPTVSKADDIENYSTSKIIDLSFRMGLLSRPEWRRLTRSYEIRRDLEHEDSEYEAGIEDTMYVFKTCIEAVLSKDPVTLFRVAEVKQIIEAAGPVATDAGLVDDYQHAPDSRQLEILKYLVSTAFEDKHPELVRQNAYSLLSKFSSATRDSVRVLLAEHVQKKLGRNPMSDIQVRVSYRVGVLPYLRKAHRKAFFISYLEKMNSVGYSWKAHASHEELLDQLSEFGGFSGIPEEIIPGYIEWMTLCYIGEPGGYGAGRSRRVFYSNTAEALIVERLKTDASIVRDHVHSVSHNRLIERAIDRDDAVARRFEKLLNLVES